MIVTWDRNPEAHRPCPHCKQVADPALALIKSPAKQVIYSTLSKYLADGDYNVYVGKVIDRIWINSTQQIVFDLRKPVAEDLNKENLNRAPIVDPAANEIVPPTSINANISNAHLMNMKHEIIATERKIKEGKIKL
jgi:hypothetical protein